LSSTTGTWYATFTVPVHFAKGFAFSRRAPLESSSFFIWVSAPQMNVFTQFLIKFSVFFSKGRSRYHNPYMKNWRHWRTDPTHFLWVHDSCNDPYSTPHLFSSSWRYQKLYKVTFIWKKAFWPPYRPPGGAVRKTKTSCTTRAQTRPNAENPSPIRPSVLELQRQLNSQMWRCVHGDTNLTLQPQRNHLSRWGFRKKVGY
jgi:hypothetical protein